MEKIKMDKVRRLLGNRYGEDVRDAILAILEHVVEVTEVEEGNEVMGKAIEGLKDLVTRASKEPRVIEVPDEEVIEG